MTDHIYLDGHPAPASPAQSVLDVLRAVGIDVPALCYEPRRPPQGTCRLCMVEVEGRPDLAAACTTYVESEMRINTNSPALRQYRQILLEMLLSETPPPSECPRCLLVEPCLLHATAALYQAEGGLFPKLNRRQDSSDPNPFIQRDYTWCIACYRCTRICQEWEMADAIVAAGRSQQVYITSYPGDKLMESPCTFCGQCINTCPTAALMDRKSLEMLRRPG